MKKSLFYVIVHIALYTSIYTMEDSWEDSFAHAHIFVGKHAEIDPIPGVQAILPIHTDNHLLILDPKTGLILPSITEEHQTCFDFNKNITITLDNNAKTISLHSKIAPEEKNSFTANYSDISTKLSTNLAYGLVETDNQQASIRNLETGNDLFSGVNRDRIYLFNDIYIQDHNKIYDLKTKKLLLSNVYKFFTTKDNEHDCLFITLYTWNLNTQRHVLYDKKYILNTITQKLSPTKNQEDKEYLIKISKQDTFAVVRTSQQQYPPDLQTESTYDIQDLLTRKSLYSLSSSIAPMFSDKDRFVVIKSLSLCICDATTGSVICELEPHELLIDIDDAKNLAIGLNTEDGYIFKKNLNPKPYMLAQKIKSYKAKTCVLTE